MCRVSAIATAGRVSATLSIDFNVAVGRLLVAQVFMSASIAVRALRFAVAQKTKRRDEFELVITAARLDVMRSLGVTSMQVRIAVASYCGNTPHASRSRTNERIRIWFACIC